VLDIGATSLAGDRRLDPIASTVYLCDPHVTPTATAHDADVALAWLRTKGLAEWLEPGRRWLAAYWSFEIDDPKVIAWCSDVLLRRQPSSTPFRSGSGGVTDGGRSNINAPGHSGNS
jgi:hypothetical protein